jgi:hypothetical protein
MSSRREIDRRTFMKAGSGVLAAGLAPSLGAEANRPATGASPLAAEARALRETAFAVKWYPFTGHPNSDTCWSLSVGPDGRIYAAACAESMPGGVSQACPLQRTVRRPRLPLRPRRKGGRSRRLRSCLAGQDPLQLRALDARWRPVHGDASFRPAHRSARLFAVVLLARREALLSRLRAARFRHPHRQRSLVGHAHPEGGLPLPTAR